MIWSFVKERSLLLVSTWTMGAEGQSMKPADFDICCTKLFNTTKSVLSESGSIDVWGMSMQNQHTGTRTWPSLLLDFGPNLQPVPVRVVIIFQRAGSSGSLCRSGRAQNTHTENWEWWSISTWSTSMTNLLSDRFSFHLLNTEDRTLSWRQDSNRKRNQRKWQESGQFSFDKYKYD